MVILERGLQGAGIRIAAINRPPTPFDDAPGVTHRAHVTSIFFVAFNPPAHAHHVDGVHDERFDRAPDRARPLATSAIGCRRPRRGCDRRRAGVHARED